MTGELAERRNRDEKNSEKTTKQQKKTQCAPASRQQAWSNNNKVVVIIPTKKTKKQEEEKKNKMKKEKKTGRLSPIIGRTRELTEPVLGCLMFVVDCTIADQASPAFTCIQLRNNSKQQASSRGFLPPAHGKRKTKIIQNNNNDNAKQRQSI
jgi:hypothetical protein